MWVPDQTPSAMFHLTLCLSPRPSTFYHPSKEGDRLALDTVIPPPPASPNLPHPSEMLEQTCCVC